MKTILSKKLLPLLIVALLLSPLAYLPRPAYALTNTIYDDALAHGWVNWSWATVDLASTAQVHAGAKSTAVTAGAWQGFLPAQPRGGQRRRHPPALLLPWRRYRRSALQRLSRPGCQRRHPDRSGCGRPAGTRRCLAGGADFRSASSTPTVGRSPASPGRMPPAPANPLFISMTFPSTVPKTRMDPPLASSASTRAPSLPMAQPLWWCTAR